MLNIAKSGSSSNLQNESNRTIFLSYAHKTTKEQSLSVERPQ